VCEVCGVLRVCVGCRWWCGRWKRGKGGKGSKATKVCGGEVWAGCGVWGGGASGGNGKCVKKVGVKWKNMCTKYVWWEVWRQCGGEVCGVCAVVCGVVWCVWACGVGCGVCVWKVCVCVENVCVRKRVLCSGVRAHAQAVSVPSVVCVTQGRCPVCRQAGACVARCVV